MRVAFFYAVLLCACSQRALPLPDARDAGTSLDLSPADLASPDLAIDGNPFIAAYAKASCDRLIRCGLLDQSEDSACLTYQTGQFNFYGHGQFTFDPSVAASCLDDLAAADCLVNHAYFCPQAFAGTRALGEPCSDDCVAGLTCSEPACPRTCVNTPRIASGGACQTNQGEGCQPGDFCLPFTDGGSGSCTPLGGVGAPCTDEDNACGEGLFCRPDAGCQPPGALGDPCFNSHLDYLRCGPGLVCQGASEFVGTCLPFVSEGQPCQLEAPCAGGLDCLPGSSGASACRRLTAEGQPCTIGRDECRFFEDCVGGVCAPIVAALGEPCTTASDSCVMGGFCDPLTLTCVLAHTVGQPCDSSVAAPYKQCYPNLCSAANLCVSCM